MIKFKLKKYYFNKSTFIISIKILFNYYIEFLKLLHIIFTSYHTS